MSFEAYRVQKARREYACLACRRYSIIAPGQLYLYAFGIVNGSPAHARFCQECCESDQVRNTEVGQAYRAAIAQAQKARP